MIFRRAIINDIQRLSQLRISMLNEEKAYNDNFNQLLLNNTIEYLKSGLENGNVEIFVAVDNEEIIAMGGINYFDLPPNDWCPRGKTAYLGNIFTCRDYRLRGLASQILNLLVEQAKNKKCERILLNTSDMGKELYKKKGFDFSPTAMALYPFGINP